MTTPSALLDKAHHGKRCVPRLIMVMLDEDGKGFSGSPFIFLLGPAVSE
jgi:hypothetical protein